MTTSQGKGLAALLGTIAEKANDIGNGRFSPDKALALDKIIAGQQQPRQVFDDEKMHDLVDSVQKNGVLQPIVVRQLSEDLYEIIAGERRFRASQQAGLDAIPAIIIECTDTEALQLGLIENLQRDDLNPMDEAEAYLRLTQEYQKTQEEIAKAVSKSRSYVANQIRLTTLSGRLKELVRNRQISPGHARNLINNPDADRIAERILTEGLNVRETEAIRQTQNTAKKSAPQSNPYQEDANQLAQKLQESLGIRAKITTNTTGGTLTFYFSSFEQLDELIQKLDG